MRGLVEERDTSIMADSHSSTPDTQAKALDDSPPPPNIPPSDIPIVPATTASESLPGNCGGSVSSGGSDSTPCSDTNSNASSTQNLSVTPNGHSYDVLQNGHLSPSEDSGIGMSDQGSQSSQSPNQSFVPTPNTCTGLATGQKVLGHGGSPNALHHQPVNHGHSSPGSYSPNNSRGDSPHDHGSPMPPQAQQPSQHIVLVHVNPGETFSVRVGDQIQHIQGPATVRMVSNNGPPLPMPMQVPPGHMVQQIVDENGVLTHVILSPQPPGMAGPGMQNPPITGGPNGGPAPMYPPYGAQYPPYGAPYPPHHHGPTPPHMVAPSQMHSSPPPPPQQHCNNHQHMYNTGGPPPPPHHSHPPPENPRKDKVTRRLRQRLERHEKTDSHYGAVSPRRAKHKVNGDTRRLHQNNGHSSSSSLDGNEMEEEDRRLIRDQLSKMSLPSVSDVCPRSALIRVTPVDLSTLELVNRALAGEVRHELLLLDKSRENKYNSVYNGACTEIKLRDLKPATEYHLKVCSRYVDVHESVEVAGDQTDCVSFKTLACEPDTPSPPKQSQKTKTSITLKWNQTNDNGAKVSSYTLESDQGLGAGDASHFTEVYNGLQRQYKVTKLQPSTRYTFRLAAINSIGKSEFCEPVSFYTSGSVPSQPDPPMLSQRHVKALTISWVKRPTDDEFSLQMEDQETGHGFLTVFNGADLVYKIKNLRRNTEYKFRLQASNEEGGSKWSDTVCYRTLADKPQPPGRPQLKGRAHSTSFKVIWDPPKDGGGCDITKFQLELDAGRGFELRYEGSETEFICDHLQPGHSYRVRARCSNGTQYSDYSERLVVETLAVPPGACHPPKLQGKPKASTLHLRWSYPDYDGGAQVTSYEVLMTLPDNTTREVYTGRDLDCTVASLLPGRYYLFQVRALNKAGAGTWSDILEVVSGAGVPDAPKSPCALCKSAQHALVEWDEPLNNGATIQEYRLEWQPQQQQDFSLLYSGTLLSHEVRGLQPATEYNFRVQAVNSAGAGAYSPIAQCTTPPSCPGAVVSLRASATANSIHLTWKEPPNNGSDVVSYNIDLGEQHMISTGNVLEYVIDDLVPETNYKVKVQAVNSIGVGPFTSLLRVTTHSLPPDPPKLECVQVAPNSVKLKWGDGRNPDQIQYCLEICKNNSFYPVYQGPLHVHKINRLQETTEYDFRIYARNKAGDGPYSQVFKCRTNKAPPPAVKEPHVSEISRDSCNVTWLPVKSMGKDTIEYTLQLQHLHGRDTEYKQIYRGEATSFKLDKLLENSEYQVRVCAHRLSNIDSQHDLTGAFSPGIPFKTKRPEPVAPSSSTTAIQAKMPERRKLSDQEWAFIILLGFTIFAVIIAFLAQWIIVYTSGNSGVSSDVPPASILENDSAPSSVP